MPNLSINPLSQDKMFFTPYNIDIDSLEETALKQYVTSVISLPSSLKNVLLSFSTAEYIEIELGNSFSLSIDQKKEICRIIRDIILGKMGLRESLTIIQSRLNLDSLNSEKLVNQLNAHFFSPLVNILSSLYPQIWKPVTPSRSPVPGQDIPETGGNIIDLRRQK